MAHRKRFAVPFRKVVLTRIVWPFVTELTVQYELISGFALAMYELISGFALAMMGFVLMNMIFMDDSQRYVVD